MPSHAKFSPAPSVSPSGIPTFARNHPCRVILSERSESNFFHRDPEWHFVPFDPRFARISTTLRMTRWKKRKAAAVAESRQGKEKGSHFDYLSRSGTRSGNLSRPARLPTRKRRANVATPIRTLRARRCIRSDTTSTIEKSPPQG